MVPDLNNAETVSFFGQSGHNLLMVGLIVSILGMVFGAVIYSRLRNMPVHRSMLEVSELIYATCKTYLAQQLKFVAILWALVADSSWRTVWEYGCWGVWIGG